LPQTREALISYCTIWQKFS